MLPLDDQKWETLVSGFGSTYNPAPLLRQLLSHGATKEIWTELGMELCNQGELGTAEYAIVPWLVEYIDRADVFDAKATQVVLDIELWRPRNPPVPEFLQPGYDNAIHRLPGVVLSKRHHGPWDDFRTQMAASVLALGQGNRWFAEAYFQLSRGQIERMIKSTFGLTEWYASPRTSKPPT